MNQQQALDALNTAHQLDPTRFINGYDTELNPTSAGEWLIDEKGVADDDAYQWAFDWVTQQEAQDLSRPKNYY